MKTKVKWNPFKTILCIIIFLVQQNGIEGQDANCDYFQSVQMGTTYYVYSRNYPNFYDRGMTCRWQAQCPANTKCKLTCEEVNIPSTPNCVGDRLLISKTGDSSLTGADKYCGYGSIAVTSNSNSLSVGFISTYNSMGGRFFCTLIAESATIPDDCQCGWKYQKRIVGGMETEINEFPMMVGLVDLNLLIIYCGGTIINEYWILTAAHCLQGQTLANVAILYGEHNVKLSDSPATKLIKSAQFIPHPNYADGYDYDIGLIKTAEKIEFGERVGPACLPFKYVYNDLSGNQVQALGWGTQSFGGSDSDYLQKVTLDVITNTVCANSLGSVVNSRTLCTYTPGKDTCQHDSGGPILYQDPASGRVYLVGVAIGGYGCATTRPGLNTRVAQHLDWITSSTAGVKYCNK